MWQIGGLYLGAYVQECAEISYNNRVIRETLL